MRTGIYVRVSTEGKGQSTDNQLHQLREWCEREGHEIVRVYEDHESGTKGRRERAGFDAMFKDAEAGRLDLVLFWSLDRFSRQGIGHTLDYLNILARYNVAVRSYVEPMLDTSNEMIRHILLAVFAGLAKIEAGRIRERTIAGLERAVRNGKTLGRPNKVKRLRPVVQQLVAQGVSKTQIAAKLGVSVKTVRAAANGE